MQDLNKFKLVIFLASWMSAKKFFGNKKYTTQLRRGQNNFIFEMTKVFDAHVSIMQTICKRRTVQFKQHKSKFLSFKLFSVRLPRNK